MGLSASQARLLSITQRINNNELQSEFISNSKIQLANQNVKASEKYINALRATKFEYISYNQTGIEENVALTFNAINNYDPLKNQYLLYNTEGQIYVNATDKANFEKSKNLYDFLNCYGLIEDYDKNRALEKANNDYDELKKEWENYYTSPEYKKYLESSAAGNPYEIFHNIVYTTDPATGQEIATSCFKAALDNPFKNPNCYQHVLGYLINPTGSQNFETSAGDTVSVGSSDVSGSTLAGDGKGQQIADSMGSVINSKYSDDSYIMVCDGDDNLNTQAKENSLQAIIDAGKTPSKLQMLMSDYVYDSATNTAIELKTVLQKAIDMMYIIKNTNEFTGTGELNATMMKDLLINFTDGDLKNVPSEPKKPAALGERPEPAQFKITDKPLAQWYTNLWYAMDGQTKSDEITSTYNDNAEFDYFTVTNATKTSDPKTSNKNYVLLDDNKASNSGWLQFALENGMVTISQATKQTNGDITWLGIEHSSTSDMREVEDTERISLAEAEYEKTVKEIQIEDKKLDQKIRKLDTEHSALEKELESIKGVMDKNTERSFAAFS